MYRRGRGPVSSLSNTLAVLEQWQAARSIALLSGLRASAPALMAFALGLRWLVVERLTSKSDFFARRPIAYDSVEPGPSAGRQLGSTGWEATARVAPRNG